MRAEQKTPIRSESRKGRTRRSLCEALLALMLEKPYQRITVANVLERASVSRSTFYSHFDGKDDLLASYHVMFFEHMAGACMRRNGEGIRIAPVAAMLDHLQDRTYRDFYLALMRAGKQPALRSDSLRILSGRFEDELRTHARGTDHIPLRLIAQFIAATFLDLVDWWVENDAPHPPTQMEAMFERMVKPAISSALGPTVRL